MTNKQYTEKFNTDDISRLNKIICSQFDTNCKDLKEVIEILACTRKENESFKFTIKQLREENRQLRIDVEDWKRMTKW